MLTGVFDALALLRLRRTLLADFSCELTYSLLVDTVYHNLVWLRNFKLDSVCILKYYRM